MRAEVITAPAEYKSKTKIKAESQDEAADSCEDLGKDKPQSDLESDDDYAVYADDEDQVSFDESGNSPNSSDDESTGDEHAGPATGGFGPATGGHPPQGIGGGGGGGSHGPATGGEAAPLYLTTDIFN